MGMLTAVDRAPFAAYCQTYARWVDAEQKIDQHGQVIRTQAGNAIQNPFVGIANRAKDLLAKFASEFGFTPSSRSRLQVAPQADTDDGWDDFLRDTNQLDSDVRNLQ
jgi:P27 family predicted phage terminase small subunit